jgi:hypothetical protein
MTGGPSTVHRGHARPVICFVDRFEGRLTVSARVQVGPSTTAWNATQGGTAGASSGTGGRSVVGTIRNARADPGLRGADRQSGRSSDLRRVSERVPGLQSPEACLRPPSPTPTPYSFIWQAACRALSIAYENLPDRL